MGSVHSEDHCLSPSQVEFVRRPIVHEFRYPVESAHVTGPVIETRHPQPTLPAPRLSLLRRRRLFLRKHFSDKEAHTDSAGVSLKSDLIADTPISRRLRITERYQLTAVGLDKSIWPRSPDLRSPTRLKRPVCSMGPNSALWRKEDSSSFMI